MRRCIYMMLAVCVFEGVSEGICEGAIDPARRVAIVIGANQAAPGRKALKFAHRDAQRTSELLAQVGGFKAQDIHMLLDPQPDATIAKIDAVLGSLSTKQPTILFFYYSGHADAQSLYPAGKALALQEVRQRLDAAPVAVRIGLIDACRGGGWTGSKGLTPTTPFPIEMPLNPTSEGSVLIASSSGLEDAHEASWLQGSFFTHHWNAALRGAADRNSDSLVTLTEAFDYAKTLTIRDTAIYTSQPQHPSFRYQLSGRQDVILAQVATAKTTLAVNQNEGPLQLIHLSTGLLLLELPKGQRRVKLAVAPGRYVLRRQAGDKTWAKEIDIRANATVAMWEENLQLTGSAGLVAKETKPRPVTLTTLQRRTAEIQTAIGVKHWSYPGSGLVLTGIGGNGSGKDVTFDLHGTYGITDRLQWNVLTGSGAYRFGQREKRELVLWGGLLSWGMGGGSLTGFLFTGSIGLGGDLRWWLSATQSLDFSVGINSGFSISSKSADEACQWETDGEAKQACEKNNNDTYHTGPDTWENRIGAAYTHTVFDTVTFHLGAQVAYAFLVDGKWPKFAGTDQNHDLSIGFGSMPDIGLRNTPLIRVHLGDIFSLDAHLGFSYHVPSRIISETYMGGATWVW